MVARTDLRLSLNAAPGVALHCYDKRAAWKRNLGVADDSAPLALTAHRWQHGRVDWESVTSYVETYSYLAVWLGTIIDHSGLTLFVVAGGVLAGASDSVLLWAVILSGAAGSLTSDLILFSIGRWRAGWLDRVVKSKKGKLRLRVIGESMHRRAFLILVLGRFMPWLGRFVPAAAGLRRVHPAKTAVYCTVGGLVGGALYGCLGYFAAGAVIWLEEYSIWFVLGALLLSIPIARYMYRRFDRAVEHRLALSRALDEEE